MSGADGGSERPHYQGLCTNVAEYCHFGTITYPALRLVIYLHRPDVQPHLDSRG